MIARLTHKDIRPTIPEKEVHWLGRVGSHDYAEHRGIEYAVTIHPVDPQAYAREPGEAMIVRHVRDLFDGSPVEHNEHYRATVAPSGTYAALVAQEAARKANAARKDIPRPLDALAAHPLMARRMPELLRIAPEADPLFAELSERTRGVILPGQERRRGPAAIVEALRGKGVELRLTADKSAIIPIAPNGRALESVRELIEQAAPLITAYLRGEPLRCQLRHSEKQPPEAESLLVGGAAACGAHLAGELAL